MNKLLDDVKKQNMKFSGNLRAFGDYILKNPNVLMHKSVEKIAKQSNSSPGTVYRYIKKFGYNSHETFIQDLLDGVYEDRRPVKYLKGSLELNLSDWNQQHFQLELENIAKTKVNFSDEDCRTAAELILHARRRWIVGWRLESSVASYLTYVLSYMLGDTTHVASGLVGESILSFKPDDVLVVMAFKRYNALTLSIMEQAKAKGLKVITITDSPESPAAQIADVSFIAETSSLYFLDSYTSALSIANALTAELSHIGKDIIQENIIYQEIFLDQYATNQSKEERHDEKN